MKDEILRKWLVSANNDFLAAGHLLSLPDEKIITNVVCYLSQPSVEKYLKAFLYFANLPFTKTHSLEVLLNKCVKADSTFSNLEVGRLTSYNISMRYPDEFRVPTLIEAKESYDTARKIKEFILSKTSVEDSDLTLF